MPPDRWPLIVLLLGFSLSFGSMALRPMAHAKSTKRYFVWEVTWGLGLVFQGFYLGGMFR